MIIEINEEKLIAGLKNTTIDLNKLASNLTLKKSFFSDHRDRLRDVLRLNDDELRHELKRYVTEMAALESIDNNITVIQRDVDRVNNGLSISLKKRFSDLTDNDIHVCVLHLLKLTIKEIATIKGVTPKSIQVARYRIKKKMNLSKEEEIVPFIENNFLD